MGTEFNPEQSLGNTSRSLYRAPAAPDVFTVYCSPELVAATLLAALKMPGGRAGRKFDSVRKETLTNPNGYLVPRS